METQKLLVMIIFIVAGLFFFFNSKKISKPASKFYRKLYTEKNLNVMFKAMGIVLLIGAALFILFD